MQERVPAGQRDGGVWRTVVMALGLFAVLTAIFHAFTVDDAFITYRHARNLARGWGPVMNPGERVEGTSSLPWTLVLGCCAWLGLPVATVAPWLSRACGVLCVLLAFRVGAHVGGRRAGGVAAVVCAAGVPLAIWSGSGMETAAAALALLAMLDLACATHRTPRTELRSGMAAGLVAAVRPEGFIFIAPLVAWAARAAAPRGRRVLRVLAGAALVVGPLVLFRWLYYGDWVPNPVHAKSPDGLGALGPGALYVAKLLVSFPLAVAACGVARSAVPGSAAGLRLARDFILTQLVFALLVGGDYFAGYRFAAVVWPCVAILCAPTGGGTAVGADGHASRWVKRLTPAACCIGVLLVAFPALLLPAATRIASLQRLHLPPAAHAVRLTGELRHLGVVLLGLGAWLLWQRFVARRLGAWQYAGAATLAAWLICLLVPTAFDPQVLACRAPDAAARYGRVVGEYLASAFPRTTLVATNAAGTLPYYSDLPVIDMLGLTDRHIARVRSDAHQWIGHERGDGDYVLSRRPELVVLGGPEGSAVPWPFLGDLQLAANPDFQRDYVLRRVPLSGFQFTYYERRDRAGASRTPAGL